MEKHRTIPDGYMRVGELAKKADVSTNTLRYYDKKGLLTPSAESESGYRLYSDKDVAKLMQILMMKQLGFSLSEIKRRIHSMDTTADVIDVLTEHSTNIRKNVELLTESLNAIESLKEEIVQVDSVDFRKFAAILEGIYTKSDHYWIMKYLENDIIDMLNQNVTKEDAISYSEALNVLVLDAAEYQKERVLPESEKGKDFASKFWKIMMALAGNDVSLISKINEQLEKSTSDKKHSEVLAQAHEFMTLSLKAYFEVDGLIPEAAKLYDDGISPESEKGQDIAKRFWNWMMELTGGDMNMIQQMNNQFNENAPDDDITRKSNLFIEKALEFYFADTNNQ
ncbi:MAG: MerR family transcriptional regulator [Oscillospiraceae bacterium]|nr:MerR family transcriptional regulator [Oscillospiraceae bacterium]